MGDSDEKNKRVEEQSEWCQPGGQYMILFDNLQCNRINFSLTKVK